jgi:hypothetical protein
MSSLTCHVRFPLKSRHWCCGAISPLSARADIGPKLQTAFLGHSLTRLVCNDAVRLLSGIKKFRHRIIERHGVLPQAHVTDVRYQHKLCARYHL